MESQVDKAATKCFPNLIKVPQDSILIKRDDISKKHDLVSLKAVTCWHNIWSCARTYLRILYLTMFDKGTRYDCIYEIEIQATQM